MVPTRWTLRTRLVVAIVCLLAIVCIVVGAITTLALHRFLLERLDGQVTAATGRAFDAREHSPDGDGSMEGRIHGGSGNHTTDDPSPSADSPSADSPSVASSSAAASSAAASSAAASSAAASAGAAALNFLTSPGQAVGTVGAYIVTGRITAAGVLTDDSPAPTVHDLTAAQAAALSGLPADGSIRTRSIEGLGTYRLSARAAAPDGDIVVAGLPVSGVQDTTSWLVLIEGVLAGSGLLIAGTLASVIVGRSLSPLRRMAATATRVSRLPLDRGDVVLAERVPETGNDPHTEVGQVTLAFNRMLGHVGAALTARQASETRVRQFVADASHELRTPLSSIRGYAEFAQRHAPALPPDVAHALSRVRSQTERMSDLVEDLLLLARLDAGRPLELAPVDLTRLVVDAVGDAVAAGPDHAWRLDLPDEAVELLGDESRLHQVITNLLANARTHTPAGTTVSTSLRPSDPDQVRLIVQDDGPGIPADLLPEVFERFARGESSRSRAAGSTGLGLAIVAAVVDAHRGRVSVTSCPGRTVFEVWLPRS